MALRLANIGSFLRDVRQELHGVQWPTRVATVRFTALIIIVSVVVAAVTGVLDVGLSALVGRFLLR